MNILVTGAAGFIGYHLVSRLISDGHTVVGVDCQNDYYDVLLKQARVEQLQNKGNFTCYCNDLSNEAETVAIFDKHRFDRVVHLAAQAGVRYSLENPQAYISSNVSGFLNLLECCRHYGTGHLVFASSSSVYGLNTRMPFSVHDNVDHPVSLYAATKKSNELMAHCYSHLYGIKTTGLRFFTVYGPWGRPDMAYFLFTKAILEKRPIRVFNNGEMSRDFTYIDDIIEGVVRVMDLIPTPNENWDGSAPDAGSSTAPYRLYNIGRGQPVPLMDFIEAVEKAVGIKAQKEFLPMQMGDVTATWADVTDLEKMIGFQPAIPVDEGMMRFVAWYLDYYGYASLSQTDNQN